MYKNGGETREGFGERVETFELTQCVVNGWYYQSPYKRVI